MNSVRRIRAPRVFLRGVRLVIASLVLFVALPACGSISQFGSHNEKAGPAIYGGVRIDLRSLWQYFAQYDTVVGDDTAAFLGLPLILLDLPLSFVADTVLLPWSLYNEIAKGGIETHSYYEIWGNPRATEPP